MGDGEKKERSGGRLKDYGDTLIKTAALTMPLGLIALVGSTLQQRMLGSPWTILWAIVPTLAVAWLTWRLAKRHALRSRQWPWLVCLVLYCSAFALASITDLLVWRQVPRDPQGIAQREWLLPVWAGDWRYWVARRADQVAQDVIVVLMEPLSGTDGRAQLRTHEAQLLRLAAAAGGVRGVGFDLYFEQQTAADAELCRAVVAARGASIPVWSGYTYRFTESGHYVERPATPALACLPSADQGHLLGFADADGRVRAVKLKWEGMEDRPAFSVVAARHLSTNLLQVAPNLKERDFLLYLPPAQEVETATFSDVAKEPSILRSKLVIVGLQTPQDRYRTPFGVRPGSVIQAYAVQSLRSGRFITRPAAWWSAINVFAGCYMLMLLAVSGWSMRRLVVVTAVLSASVFAVAVVVMWVWLIWLDVVYVVTAMWVLLPLLAILRKRVGVSSVDEPLRLSN